MLDMRDRSSALPGCDVLPAALPERRAGDGLRELVADIRARSAAGLACLSHHRVGERHVEVLAADAETPAALARLSELTGPIGRRIRPGPADAGRVAVEAQALRMTFGVDVSNLLVLALHRADGWGDADVDRASTLRNDVERYVELWWRHRRMRMRCRGLQSALDLHDIGVVLLDGRGELMFANRRATALIDARDGLRRTGASITTARLDDAVRFQTALAHVLDDDGSTARRVPITLVHRQPGARPLVAALVPIAQPGADRHDPAAAIYLIDPDAGTNGLIEPICRVYGLTAVEARLARHLVDGATIAEAAQRMRVKPQTAKAYLKSVFIKTGAHRQADLVRLLISSLMRADPQAEMAIF